MDGSCIVRLERCDPARRMLRFYVLQAAPDLFGEWCLLRALGADRERRADADGFV